MTEAVWIYYNRIWIYENRQKGNIFYNQMLTYPIRERGTMPIYLFLYHKIREDITAGRLQAGEKLPSKRTLATHNGISVITVEYAYHLLADEGYIRSRERSGYFVCDLRQGVAAPPVPMPVHLPESLAVTAPDPDFPFATLSRIMRQVLSRYGEALLVKPPHNGCEVLRRAIADYLRRYRGMEVEPERIVVGSGAEYLYMMIVQLLGRERLYGIENPSYDKIRAAYTACGARCELLHMDACGIAGEALARTKAQVLHVTPYHSYPTGVTAPAAKRFEFLAWADRTGGILIEDDFDSEFAPSGKPVETLFSMDTADRVIYLNTFSKTMAPSMRMGYMILPAHLTGLYAEKLGFYSSTVPVFDQYVLAEFINGGYFERRLNRLRRQAAGKREEAP